MIRHIIWYHLLISYHIINRGCALHGHCSAVHGHCSALTGPGRPCDQVSYHIMSHVRPSPPSKDSVGPVLLYWFSRNDGVENRVRPVPSFCIS